MRARVVLPAVIFAVVLSSTSARAVSNECTPGPNGRCDLICPCSGKGRIDVVGGLDAEGRLECAPQGNGCGALSIVAECGVPVPVPPLKLPGEPGGGSAMPAGTEANRLVPVSITGSCEDTGDLPDGACGNACTCHVSGSVRSATCSCDGHCLN